MTGLLAAALVATGSLGGAPDGVPRLAAALECRLCEADDPVYASTALAERERALEARLAGQSLRIQTQVTDWRRRSVTLGVVAVLVPLALPVVLLMTAILLPPMSAALPLVFTLAIISPLLSPICLLGGIGAYYMGLQAHRNELEALNREHAELQRELREVRRQRERELELEAPEDDLPPPPLVPVVALRF